MLEQEAFVLGYQAYIWGYPYVKTLLLKNEATHPQSRNYAPVNAFRYYDELAKPGFHDFTPTVEALMNVGWMDLSQGPIVLDVPKVADRYWSVVASDAGGAGTGVTSTVNLTAVNDAPALNANGSSPTFTEDGSAVTLFGSANAIPQETGQTLTGLTLTVTNVSDTTERLGVDGAAEYIAKHHLTGWYWRVVQEGSASPDDALELHTRYPDSYSLLEAMTLWAEHRPDLGRLGKLAQSKGIATHWQGKILQRLDYLSK